MVVERNKRKEGKTWSTRKTRPSRKPRLQEDAVNYNGQGGKHINWAVRARLGWADLLYRPLDPARHSEMEIERLQIRRRGTGAESLIERGKEEKRRKKEKKRKKKCEKRKRKGEKRKRKKKKEKRKKEKGKKEINYPTLLLMTLEGSRCFEQERTIKIRHGDSVKFWQERAPSLRVPATSGTQGGHYTFIYINN
jgi:hypothetical protein